MKNITKYFLQNKYQRKYERNKTLIYEFYNTLINGKQVQISLGSQLM